MAVLYSDPAFPCSFIICLYPYLICCLALLVFELYVKVIILYVFFVTCFFSHRALHFQESSMLCVPAVHSFSLLYSTQSITILQYIYPFH